MFLDDLLESFAETVGVGEDQVRYAISISVVFFFGFVYRTVFHVQRVGAVVRHWVSLIWALCLLFFLYGRDGFHVIASATFSYLFMSTFQRKFAHVYVREEKGYIGNEWVNYTFCTGLVASMGYLSLIHIRRLLTDDDRVADISLPLMFATVKMTYVGLAINDVHSGNGKEDCTSNGSVKHEKYEIVRKVPTFLEYYSYILQFSTLICGPPGEFHEFKAFIEGCKQKSDNGSNQKDGFLKDEPSPLIPALTKYLFGHVAIVVYVLLTPYLAFKNIGDEHRLKNSNLLSNIIFVELAVYYMKAKYYSVFYLSNACINMAGYGFNGYDEKNNAKWDKFKMIDVVGMEKALSLKEESDAWNIQTSKWLKRCVYEKVPYMPVFFTFLFSAFWHGFHPGYYVLLLSYAIGVLLSKKLRKKIRPYFLRSSSRKRMYDVITFLLTRLCHCFFMPAFTMLDIKGTVRFWRATYWYGFIMLFIGFIMTTVLPDVKVAEKNNNNIALGNGKEHQY